MMIIRKTNADSPIEAYNIRFDEIPGYATFHTMESLGLYRGFLPVNELVSINYEDRPAIEDHNEPEYDSAGFTHEDNYLDDDPIGDYYDPEMINRMSHDELCDFQGVEPVKSREELIDQANEAQIRLAKTPKTLGEVLAASGSELFIRLQAEKKEKELKQVYKNFPIQDSVWPSRRWSADMSTPYDLSADQMTEEQIERESYMPPDEYVPKIPPAVGNDKFEM